METNLRAAWGREGKLGSAGGGGPPAGRRISALPAAAVQPLGR